MKIKLHLKINKYIKDTNKAIKYGIPISTAERILKEQIYEIVKNCIKEKSDGK